MGEYYIGIDLGGTNVKFGLFDKDIKLIAKSSTPTNADMGADVLVQSMGKCVEQLLMENSLDLDDITSAGLGSPDPARYSEGIIEAATNMPKFKNIPIRDMLAKRLGKPIVFDNDANVACYGEFAVGAGKDADNMIFFTLGTGIGGGIVNAGKLLQGAGDNAAELGHLIVYPGGRQ